MGSSDGFSYSHGVSVWRKLMKELLAAGIVILIALPALFKVIALLANDFAKNVGDELDEDPHDR